MSYNVTSRVTEFARGQVPPEYVWRCKELQLNTGWSVGQYNSYCERNGDFLPHVVERRGLLTTRFFNPREVAEWMKREAARKAALNLQ